jgi:hypothetical protein
MQHASLPDRDTTGRTRHGGYLFGREFVLLHFDRLRYTASRIYTILDTAVALVAQMPIPGRLRRGGAIRHAVRLIPARAPESHNHGA